MIISLANQKGGVGKTTSTITLADLLARSGYQVLVIDTDVQGHIAISLGLEKSPSLYRLIVERSPIAALKQSARKNLDIIASDKMTENAKLILTGMPFREQVLADALRYPDELDYDLIFVDLAPSLDILHIAALMASHFVIIPTRLDTLSLDGVNELIKSIQQLNSQGGKIEGYAILPTFFDRVTRESTINLKALVDAYGAQVWPPIPQDVKAREAPSFGQTLAEYAPHCAALLGYSPRLSQPGGYMAAMVRLMEKMG